MCRLQSIQIGRVIQEGDPDSRDVTKRCWTTAFYKQPVAGPVQVTSMGLEGDSVADRRNHGGVEKAVLCYSAKHYTGWNERHLELQMSAGAMAENFTLSGLDETNVCIGDQFEIGECCFEVSQPRQPCWKIVRRWGIKTLLKEVTQTGWIGWYLRVIREGVITAGEAVQRTHRPQPDWPIARANDILFGREVDRAAVMELMSLPQLSDQWKEAIA